MSLTAIAILLMLLGFLCVVVGFIMGGDAASKDDAVITIHDRTGVKRYTTKGRARSPKKKVA
jgi:hypothetical protein